MATSIQRIREECQAPKVCIEDVGRRGKSVFQQAEADRFGDRLAPATGLELLVDVGYVSFDCLGRDDERLGDLFVAQPLRQERQDLVLAVGQRVDQLRPARR